MLNILAHLLTIPLLLGCQSATDHLCFDPTAGSNQPASDAETPTEETEPRTMVVYTPVGKQFLMIGLEAGFWLGSGTISALPSADGTSSQGAGDVSDQAASSGPVFIGLHHVVEDNFHFGLRLGAGAVIFPNDRLINAQIGEEGELHVGTLLGAEILARYVSDGGFTVGGGMNLSTVGLPDSNGAFLAISPRIGYMLWGEKYRDFWLFEAGYKYPVINGLVPEFKDDVAEPPIESSWHMFTLSVAVGL